MLSGSLRDRIMAIGTNWDMFERLVIVAEKMSDKGMEDNDIYDCLIEVINIRKRIDY